MPRDAAALGPLPRLHKAPTALYGGLTRVDTSHPLTNGSIDSGKESVEVC